MKVIKVKYIIGPYREDPYYFTDMSIKLSQKLISQSKDNETVLSIHSGLLNNAFGYDEIEEERIRGIKITGNLLEYIAQQKQNELHVIGDRGSIARSEGTQAELRRWKQSRKEYWSNNIFFHYENEGIK